MKYLLTLLITVMLLVGSNQVLAQSRTQDLNLRIREYHVTVDLKPRILIIERDANGATYMQWFSNSAFEPKMQFLGKEIYERGIKVSDTFKEND